MESENLEEPVGKRPFPNGTTWTILPDKQPNNRIWLDNGAWVKKGQTYRGWRANCSGFAPRGWVSVIHDDSSKYPQNLLVYSGADSIALALIDAQLRQVPGRRVVDLSPEQAPGFVSMLDWFRSSMKLHNDESGEQVDLEGFDMVNWCRIVSHIAEEMRSEVMTSGAIDSPYGYKFGFFLASRRLANETFRSIPSYRVPSVAADLGEILALTVRFRFYTDFRGALVSAVARFLEALPMGFGPLADGALGLKLPQRPGDARDARNFELFTEMLRPLIESFETEATS